MTLTFALQASQIMRQFGLILTSFLLAKIGLPMNDIGVFETLLFIGTSLSYFWINGLIQSILAFMPSVQQTEKPSTYFSIALIFVALSVFLFLVLRLFPTFILSSLTASLTIPYFDVFSLYLLFNLAPFFLEGFWAVENSPLSIFVFSGISNLILPFAVAIPLWFNYSFEASFYGLLILAFIRFIWFIIVLISLLRNNNALIINSIYWLEKRGFVAQKIFWRAVDFFQIKLAKPILFEKNQRHAEKTLTPPKAARFQAIISSLD
ncbi:MAG: hypothetical protein U5L45_24220 [Saprospiraceae bacterium]|nr:hypothetical protein [Saprospiraceae bacterium]